MKVCECDKWKRSMEQIDNYFMLGWTHGMRYTGDEFIYCPWCAKELKEEGDPPYVEMMR